MASINVKIFNRIKDDGKHVLDINSGVPDEMLYGRAGYLFTLLFIRKRIDENLIENKLIENVRPLLTTGN